MIKVSLNSPPATRDVHMTACIVWTYPIHDKTFMITYLLVIRSDIDLKSIDESHHHHSKLQYQQPNPNHVPNPGNLHVEANTMYIWIYLLI